MHDLRLDHVPGGGHASVEKTPGLSFATRAVHAGSPHDPRTGAVIPSISLSTTFAQTRAGVPIGPHDYSRAGNPNRDALEVQLAAFELDVPTIDGEQALAVTFASGSAATATAIQEIAGHGGHVVSISDVYGGTYRYMTRVAKVQGIDVSFVDMSSTHERDEQAVEQAVSAAFTDRTKLLWVETPTNPTLRLADIALLARLAHSKGALLLVDNTFASPFYQRPVTLGADIVLHSATKFINGHSDVVLGVLVSPHAHLIEAFRFAQKAVGAVPSPFDCWLAQRGAKTLAIRMRQHGLNALAVATWLNTTGRERGYVRDVWYPGLKGSSTAALAWRQLSTDAREWATEQGFTEQTGFPTSGIVSFKIASAAGDVDAAERALQNLRLFTFAESLGGVESLAEHPARMTHASVSVEDRAKLGIDDDLIRLSVGIEGAGDLIADLDQALRLALGAGKSKNAA